MNRQETVDFILSQKLVVIIRCKEQLEVAPIVDALVESGIKALEITCNTPGFAEEIRAARERHPEVLIGAGTVISLKLANDALEAGAQFFVTPNVQKQISIFAHEHDLPIMIGALTPTEVAEAIESKADVVKIFPADILGIPYMKALMGPFDKVPFFAVGGIGIENAKDWIDAGAKGIGIGGKLTKIDKHGTEEIRKAATELISILQS